METANQCSNLGQDSDNTKAECDLEGKDNSTGAEHIKHKLPGLIKLTLPSTPELPIDPTNESGNSMSDILESDGSIDADSPTAEPILHSMPFPKYNRMKTRLQDPPPLTPAVKSQLTYCKTSLVRQRTFMVPSAEVHTPKADAGTTGMLPIPETDQEALTQENVGLGHVASNSKMKAPTNGEEEQEVLVDEEDIVEKKLEENKWLLITQWCSLLVLVALLVCTNKIHRLEKVTFLGLNLWRWQALTLVIFCGHLISGWIMKLFVALIEKQYLLKKKVLYFVYGLRHSVKSSIWLALVLGVWEVIFQGHEDTRVVNIMTRILWCFFTAAMAWMLKVLAVKIAANSFHRKAYFDRIQECLFNQYLLERLSGPPSMPYSHDIDDFDTYQYATRRRKHKNAAQSLKALKEPMAKTLLKTHSENFQSNVQFTDKPYETDPPSNKSMRLKLTSFWHKSRKKPHNIKAHELHGMDVRQVISTDPTEVDGLGTPDGNVEKEGPHHNFIDIGCTTPKASISVPLPGQSVTAPATAKASDTVQQERLQELTSETVSVWTLKKLMRTIRNTNLKTYSSLLAHEKGDSTIDSEVQARIVAKQVFYNIARHGRKSIALQNFIHFIPEEHLARAFAMFETTESGEITKESFIKWVVNVYTERRALCLTLNDNRTVVEKLHRLLNAVLVMIMVPVFVLIFGVDTTKILVFFTSVFLPSVFMFGNSAKNVFESLIFLFITHPFDVGDRIVVDGQSMLVEEMNILNTILLSSSNEKLYYPNVLLCTKPITNYYRSPDMWDSIEFQIHMRTPVEKVVELKDRIQKHIECIPQHWYPEVRIVCKDIEDSTKMKMAMWMRHHLNYQEGGERFQRRSDLLMYLKQQLEDLEISYQLPRQEIIVTGIPAPANDGPMLNH